MKLIRTDFKTDGILGKLYDEDGLFLAVTLEHSYDGKPKVPAGVYRCVRRNSPKFGYDVFMLKDVPGHDFIEFHVANWQRDLDGCIGLGSASCESLSGTMIVESNKTFHHFMDTLDGIDAFTLVIDDGITA